ncbi:uncharacterized protein [Amphiura filiformis]|uniref:uncharacterized protein n=1 Tax=Amphiura filiformis TaxID=82378 RepID=UPI003B216D82
MPVSSSSSHFSSARDGLSMNRSSRPGSTLIDLSPRENSSSTTNPRRSLNNDVNGESSPRDPYSTLIGDLRRNSSPVPPPRTSASLGARDSLLNHSTSRESPRQPNSVFRQHLRQTTNESQDSLPTQRQRANSEQPRTSSPRFRNLLSRRGSSSSNSSRDNSQNNDNTSSGNNEGRRSRSSFWRNSIFSRLGSAERRSRSRSESAASSQSNSAQESPSASPQPPAGGTDNNPDPEVPGFPFRRAPMSRDRGRGFNRNDSTSRDTNGPRIIRLTLGPSGADIGRLLSARNQDGPSSSGATGSGTSNEEELGMQIALIGSPLMSPPVDLTTIPPRLLLSFLLQGRRELGNEFVELVLENLLLSILARHMMEVGGQVGGSGAHPPATQEMIDKLEGFIVEQSHVDEDLNCAICHVEYELSEKLSKLPCSHFFHPTCITIWLKKSATCPVCRFKLTRPSETPTETL